jgi:hypothetical protein
MASTALSAAVVSDVYKEAVAKCEAWTDDAWTYETKLLMDASREGCQRDATGPMKQD